MERDLATFGIRHFSLPPFFSQLNYGVYYNTTNYFNFFSLQTGATIAQPYYNVSLCANGILGISLGELQVVPIQLNLVVTCLKVCTASPSLPRLRPPALWCHFMKPSARDLVRWLLHHSCATARLVLGYPMKSLE